jgi:enamine deaminase RidA (YjgF/YER057c/UK114 family)
MDPERRLAERLSALGLQLPPPPAPKGVYKPLVRLGNVIHTSGHLPIRSDGQLITGRVGEGLDVQAGYDAARLAGLGILASLRKELGTLDHVRRVIKVLGVVNCTPAFTQQPAVINGCSELFAEIFGPETGVGARSAIAAPTLPLGAPVEIEAMFEIA